MFGLFPYFEICILIRFTVYDRFKKSFSLQNKEPHNALKQNNKLKKETLIFGFSCIILCNALDYLPYSTGQTKNSCRCKHGNELLVEFRETNIKEERRSESCACIEFCKYMHHQIVPQR